MSYEWNKPATSTIRFGVAINENGHLAGEGDEAVGTKTISLNGIKTDSDFDKADAVYNEIYGKIAGARYDKSTGVKTVQYFVKEVE